MAKPKIMVVDDEKQMTKLLRLVLEEHLDCEVVTYNDPNKALQRLKEEHFDLLSLDHRMPDMTGVELLRRLRMLIGGLNTHIPVLMFTGFREEAESLSMDMIENLLFVEKPIDDERYIRNVKLALEMSKKKPAA